MQQARALHAHREVRNIQKLKSTAHATLRLTTQRLHVPLVQSCLVSRHQLHAVMALFNVPLIADETPAAQKGGLGARPKVTNQLALRQSLGA